MGFPAAGRSVFICPLGSFDHLKSNVKCKDLYLNLVPPKVVSVSNSNELTMNGTFTEPKHIKSENGVVVSPKTLSFQTKLASPSTSSVSSWKPYNCIPMPHSSVCLEVASVRLALVDEKELLQKCASRWLYGRYLLGGNIVFIPLVFGQICAFLVEGADNLLTGYKNSELMQEEKHSLLSCENRVWDSGEEGDVALLVGYGTNVHLSDPISLVGTKPSKASMEGEDLTYKLIADKDACGKPRLGGLSKESAALKEIIMFSFRKKGHFPRFSFHSLQL